MFNHVPCFSYLFGHVTVIVILRLLFAHFCPVYVFFLRSVYLHFCWFVFHTSLRVPAQTLLMIFVDFCYCIGNCLLLHYLWYLQYLKYFKVFARLQYFFPIHMLFLESLSFVYLIFVFLFPVVFNICRELLNLPCPEFLTTTPFVLLRSLQLVPLLAFSPFYSGFLPLFSLVFVFKFSSLRSKTCGELYGVAPGTHHTHVPIPVQTSQYYYLCK